MGEEKKSVEFKDGKLVFDKEFDVDPNKDGEALLKIKLGVELDIAEIPDEAVDAWKKLKDKKD